MSHELTARRVDVIKKGLASRQLEKSPEKGPTEKVHERSFVGEGPREKVRGRRAVGRRSDGEGLSEKRDVVRRGPFGKRVVAKKVALIPCEEKNKSLIFID